MEEVVDRLFTNAPNVEVLDVRTIAMEKTVLIA